MESDHSRVMVVVVEYKVPWVEVRVTEPLVPTRVPCVVDSWMLHSGCPGIYAPSIQVLDVIRENNRTNR